MRIILGNNSLKYLAGSETWTESMALALYELGHQVACFTPLLGELSRRLHTQGVFCTDNLAELVNFIEADLILANHWPVVDALRDAYADVPIISTIHGIYHHQEGKRALEHPALEAGVTKFVAVSEEVQAMLEREYGLSSCLIRNGISSARFSCASPVRAGKPGCIMLNSNHARRGGKDFQVLLEVANHYGADLVGMGAYLTPNAEPWKLMVRVDVVLGLGRSVLEGLAMGRLGIVHGPQGTAGVVYPGVVTAMQRVNYSGRNATGEVWSVDRFIAEIDKHYTADTLRWGVRHIAKNHDVIQAAKQYLRLAATLQP